MSANAFTIAAAEARDIGEIAGLFRAYEAHIGVDLSYQGFADELATLPGKYAPPRGQLLIARDAGGAAIGCVALRPMEAPGCCEMKRLFVSAQGRGLGLGRALTLPPPLLERWKPTYVFETIVPKLRAAGVAEEKIHTMLVENPRRYFGGVA